MSMLHGQELAVIYTTPCPRSKTLYTIFIIVLQPSFWEQLHSRIDGTSISGKIPAFIGNWTNVRRLDMQGTSIEGPIPSTISLMTSLNELRISDLNVSNMNFSDLRNQTGMLELVLRNCSIVGSIPSYILQTFLEMETLDLSFNKLTGEIP